MKKYQQSIAIYGIICIIMGDDMFDKLRRKMASMVKTMEQKIIRQQKPKVQTTLPRVSVLRIVEYQRGVVSSGEKEKDKSQKMP